MLTRNNPIQIIDKKQIIRCFGMSVNIRGIKSFNTLSGNEWTKYIYTSDFGNFIQSTGLRNTKHHFKVFILSVPIYSWHVIY